jgi:outer membrane immunogenic protein
MKISRVLLCSVLGTVLAAPAFAQPASTYQQKAPTSYNTNAYNWTGAYVGLDFGGQLGTSDKKLSNGTDIGEFSVDGVNGGLVAGYNYEFYNNIVLGIEGDISGSSASGSKSCNSAGYTCATDNPWFATVRPRAGYAIGRFLPYVTAGYAVGDIRAERTGGVANLDHNLIKSGWTAGAGAEMFVISHWTAKLEYLYMRYDDASMPAATGTGTTATPLDSSVIRIGMNYKF